MSPNFSVAKIVELKLSDELYTALLNQLEKDFSMCGISWSHHYNILPENLFDNISEMITKILNGKISLDIRVLLYRIDVNEKALRQIEVLNISEITTLVIEREMEKVWLRLKYSNI